jgi:peptidoglycan hydrolase CwlO-like protein
MKMTVTLLTIVLVVTLGLLLYQTYKINEMQKHYITAEEQRVEPIQKEIIELESQNQITLEYVQEKQKEFAKLEQELKKKPKHNSMSVDDALKILGK